MKENIIKKFKSFFKSETLPWGKYYKNIPSKLSYPAGSMVDVIEETAEKFPNLPAYEYFSTKCTYNNFIKKINSAAKSLKVLGVKENDKVSICMPNTPEGIIFFYAVNMIGAVANMIHPLSSETELEMFLKKAKSKIVLTIDLTYEKINSIRKNTSLTNVIIASPAEEMDPLLSIGYWLTQGRKTNTLLEKCDYTWKEFYSLGETFEESYKIHRTKDDIAAILYSGGTTGTPKGILLTNLAFNSIALQCKYMVSEARPGCTILSAMPIFHGFGLGVCIHTPLTIGGKCILIPSLNPKKFSKTIKNKKPNLLPVVPTLLEIVLKDNSIKKDAYKDVELVICGGDFLNYDLKAKTEKYFREHGSNAIVRIGYGLTESTAATCASPLENYKPNCIGIPFPDNLYKIVQIGTEYEAPVGTDGEICMNGPSIMKGYLDNEKETADTLKVHADGKLWLHTGDLGMLGEDGLIYFKARIKRLIISNGYNIYPSYLEEIINKHPLVETSTVVAMKHSVKNQVAKAVIVLKDNKEATSEVKNEIKRYCRKNIASYSMPFKFEYVSTLPKTKMGKIAYKELEN